MYIFPHIAGAVVVMVASGAEVVAGIHQIVFHRIFHTHADIAHVVGIVHLCCIN